MSISSESTATKHRSCAVINTRPAVHYVSRRGHLASPSLNKSDMTTTEHLLVLLSEGCSISRGTYTVGSQNTSIIPCVRNTLRFSFGISTSTSQKNYLKASKKFSLIFA
jgi:hypothetical protein